MIYLIHNDKGLYLPNDKCGYWTENVKNAKKYVDKPAMFRRLLKLMEESPKREFYFETMEMISKGSQTLGAYNRIKKIKEIKKNIPTNEEDTTR